MMMNKHAFPNVLVIGSNHRKAGKTTLMTMIIHHFQHQQPVAIKVAAYHDRDHFQQQYPGHGEFLLIDEHKAADQKDSRRYLKAGANRSFFIAGMQDQLLKKLPEILNTFSDKPILIESNWFALTFKPGYLLLLEDKSVNKYKSSFTKLKEKANSIVPPGTIDVMTLNFWHFQHGLWQIPGKS
ncbi:MAG: hypothetical protein ACQESZ_03800 [Bacteroidota bacterium]